MNVGSLIRYLMDLGVRALFVDLDMTLADTMRGLIIALGMIQREFHLEFPLDIDVRTFTKAYYKDSLVRIGEPRKRWIFWRSAWLKYLENKIYGTPTPCSEDFLRESAGRIPTAIVTGREVEARYFIDELRYYGFPIDSVRTYSTGDLGFGATKKDLYEYLAKRYEDLGFPRRFIAVISDSPRDLAFAREVGFRAIGYLPFNDKEVEEMLQRASGGHVIKTLCLDHGLS